MYWIYDEPIWLMGILFTATFIGGSCLTVFTFRAAVNPWFHGSRVENEAIGLAVTSCFVLLALLLGLITVATYQNYSSISGTVDDEAAALGEFCMDAQALPPPYSGQIVALAADYMRVTVNDDWPLQQRGVVPQQGTQAIAALTRALMTFSPRDDRESDLFKVTLDSMDKIISARRIRLANVDLGLPPVLWWTLCLCVLLNVLMTAMQDLEIHVHYILCGAVAVMLGLVIFLTAELDNPFRGTVSVSPDAIAQVLQCLPPR